MKNPFPWKEFGLLVLIWLVLTLAYFAAIVSIVILPFVAFASKGILTLFYYYSAFLLLYVPVRIALRALPAGKWQGRTAAVTALAATFGIACLVPAIVNPVIRERADALLAQDKPASVTLAPVGSIALVNLENNPLHADGLNGSSGRCDDFCIALLLSGYAGEVLVNDGYSTDAEIPPGTLGKRFVLKGTRPDCIAEQEEWRTGFAGKPYDLARQTTGFSWSFQQRYAACVSEAGRAPVAKADMIFVKWIAGFHPGEPFWTLVQTSLGCVQAIFENRGGKTVKRMRQSEAGGLLLARPMYVTFYNGPMGSAWAEWARVWYPQREYSPFYYPDWWDMIANGQEIYLRAVGQDGPGPGRKTGE